MTSVDHPYNRSVHLIGFYVSDEVKKRGEKKKKRKKRLKQWRKNGEKRGNGKGKKDREKRTPMKERKRSIQ